MGFYLFGGAVGYLCAGVDGAAWGIIATTVITGLLNVLGSR